METTYYLIPVYAAYAVVAVSLTIWLARTLFKSGTVFLRDVFEEPDLAEAVNRLLVVGFYLLNLGYAALLLRAGKPDSAVAAIETLAFKLGLLLMSLGVMHFANMYLFHRIRRRGRENAVTSPYRTHPSTLPDGQVEHAAKTHDVAHSAFDLVAMRRNAT